MLSIQLGKGAPICLDAHETYYSFGAHSLSHLRRGELTKELLVPFIRNLRLSEDLLFTTACDRVKARGSHRIFQSDTTQLLLCLSGLFPLSDLWYSSSSLSHRPSTFELCELLVSLSRTHNTSKLCRWLAGVFRESLHPYFIRSLSNVHSIFSHCVLIL